MALHFASRMMQYVLFNALDVKFEVIISFLRNVAECWKDDRMQMQRLLDIVNKFKLQVQQFESFQDIWQLLASVENASLTDLQYNFMVMLSRHGMLAYRIQPPASEDSAEFLAGEKALAVNYCVDSENGLFKNCWTDDTITRRMARVVLLQVFSHKNLLIVPIKWEGSVRKLLAEFTSVSNLVYDIPVMDAAAAAGEIMRRVKHLANHAGLAGRKRQQFSTPYTGFHHTHMPEFNRLALQSMAVPQGLTMSAVLKEQKTTTQKEALMAELPQRTTTCGWSNKMITITELQWPYRFSAARLIDSENQLWSFDLSTMLGDNKGLNVPHVDFAGTGFFYYPSASLCQAAVAKEIKRQFGTEDIGSDLFQDFENLSRRLDYIKKSPQFHVSHTSILHCRN